LTAAKQASASELSGKGIVVTRPREQAAILAAMIEAQGGQAIVFPALEIEDLPDLRPVLALIERLREFANALALLDLSPAGLESAVRPRAAVRWSVWNLAYFLFGVPIAALGHLLFFVPYQLTAFLTRDPGLPPDLRSARKLLGGGALYLLWCLLLAVAAGLWFGPPAAIAAAVSLPLLALLTLAVRERWRDAQRELRQYFVLRETGNVRRRLLIERRELAQRLESIRRGLPKDGE